jgi:hypothetical protein
MVLLLIASGKWSSGRWILDLCVALFLSLLRFFVIVLSELWGADLMFVTFKVIKKAHVSWQDTITSSWQYTLYEKTV